MNSVEMQALRQTPSPAPPPRKPNPALDLGRITRVIIANGGGNGVLKPTITPPLSIPTTYDPITKVKIEHRGGNGGSQPSTRQQNGSDSEETDASDPETRDQTAGVQLQRINRNAHAMTQDTDSDEDVVSSDSEYDFSDDEIPNNLYAPLRIDPAPYLGLTWED